ncbi:hypothetical protein RI367_000859 [Sorochytrium milnesiophthora]
MPSHYDGVEVDSSSLAIETLADVALSLLPWSLPMHCADSDAARAAASTSSCSLRSTSPLEHNATLASVPGASQTMPPLPLPLPAQPVSCTRWLPPRVHTAADTLAGVQASAFSVDASVADKPNDNVAGYSSAPSAGPGRQWRRPSPRFQPVTFPRSTAATLPAARNVKRSEAPRLHLCRAREKLLTDLAARRASVRIDLITHRNNVRMKRVLQRQVGKYDRMLSQLFRTKR